MKADALVAQIEQELGQIREAIAQVEMLLELIRQTENQNIRIGLVSGLALHLHSFYTGAERIFYDIARDIDGEVPTGSDWHRQLLEQMAVEIQQARPPVLTEQTRLELDEFRRFRHVVRSNYAYKLDPERILALAQKLPALFEHLLQDCLRFCVGLQQQSYPPDLNLNINEPPSR